MKSKTTNSLGLERKCWKSKKKFEFFFKTWLQSALTKLGKF